MDKELYEAGELKLELKDGKIALVLDTKGVDVAVSVDSDYFLDKLAEVIPGEIDDAVFGMLKAALKM